MTDHHMEVWLRFAVSSSFQDSASLLIQSVVRVTSGHDNKGCFVNFVVLHNIRSNGFARYSTSTYIIHIKNYLFRLCNNHMNILVINKTISDQMMLCFYKNILHLNYCCNYAHVYTYT